VLTLFELSTFPLSFLLLASWDFWFPKLANARISVLVQDVELVFLSQIETVVLGFHFDQHAFDFHFSIAMMQL
jgi:hypothetical protein